MNIAIIGPNCAGKTTCAKRIAKEFGLLRFSLGQMIKDSIRNHTLLGLMAHPYVTRGTLSPISANTALEEKSRQAQKHVVSFFDGFPALSIKRFT